MKKIRSLVLAFLILSSSLCFSAAKKVYVSQVVKHPALDVTYKGIVDALNERGYADKKNLEIKYEQAQGNAVLSTQISRKFISEKPDVLVGIGTTTTQSLVKSAAGKIPVTFASVTDPVEAQIVTDLNGSKQNVTGASNFVDIEPQLKFIKEIMQNLKTLGVIYNPGEANSVKLLSSVNEIAKKLSIKIESSTANRTSEVPTATKFLVGKVDAIFITNDNTALSAFSSITKIAIKQRIPVFVSDVDIADQGAIASLGPNQYILGKQVGNQIADILEGKVAGDMPVQFPKVLNIYLNKNTADKLGIKFSDELLNKATKVIR